MSVSDVMNIVIKWIWIKPVYLNKNSIHMKMLLEKLAKRIYGQKLVFPQNYSFVLTNLNCKK